MAKHPTYDDMSEFKTPTQRRTTAQIAMLRQDIEKIDSVIATGRTVELEALHIELDGTYGAVITDWGTSMYGYFKGYGFNYECLDVCSIRENLLRMKGKLRGYMFQLGPVNESTSHPEQNQYPQSPTVRRSMYDIITGKKMDIAKEYERIWRLFNTSEHIGRVTPLARHVDGCMQFFPQKFKARALDLADFNATFGFSFPCPNAAITEDELVSYCEYVITLCDHLWEYGDMYMEEDAEYLKPDLYQTVESCMDELGLVAAKRDNITIYVAKDPAVVAAADLVDESLSYDVKEYTHSRTKGNLIKKKTILKFLADEIEPKRKMLKANNLGALEGLLFQMLQKFVRHNNEDNAFIRNLSPDELEMYYDDIYQLWLTATLEIDAIERQKRAKEVLGKINTPMEPTGR